MGRRRRSIVRRSTATAIVVVAFVAVAAWSAAGAAAASRPGADWHHALAVLKSLRKQPPSVPIVYLLGDSLAWECTVDDRSWATQVRRYGGGRIVAFNLGSRNQTFGQSAALVGVMPRRRAIAFIGVDPGRFAAAPIKPVLKLDRRLAASYAQHHYTGDGILSVTRKKAQVRDWVRRRYPAFRRNYLGNLMRLDTLIVACERRGLRPVLLELPHNTAVAGHRLDRALSTIRYGCRSLAALHDIPFVSLEAQARLVNADFHDLAHMVESGRVKWQRPLAKRTAGLLKLYGMR
jgi:hypothetical protein